MDNESRENGRDPVNGENRDNSAGKNDDYVFMNQVIKKKPVDKKAWALRIIVVLILAVCAGILAAFVFVKMVPVAENLVGADKTAEKVQIPSGKDDDSSTVIAASSSSSAEASSSSAPEETPAPSETVTATPTPIPSPTPLIIEKPEEKDYIRDYRNLYREMQNVAYESEKSLVQVIASTQEQDFFNQNYTSQAQACGVCVAETSENLYILTNHHQLAGAEELQVALFNNTVVGAQYQGSDEETDLAVVSVAKADIGEETLGSIQVAHLDSAGGVSRGEPILVLGNPFGYANSMAFGMVTSITNKISVIDAEYNVYLTDIEGSESGSGVMVNLDGEVIGILSAQPGEAIGSKTITAFAFSQIRGDVERLCNNEKQPYVGIRGQDVTPGTSQQSGVPEGILVTSVVDDSPAMLSGIKEYDVITAIGDEETKNLSKYQEIISNYAPGTAVQIKVMRKGAEDYEEMQFDLQIGER